MTRDHAHPVDPRPHTHEAAWRWVDRQTVLSHALSAVRRSLLDQQIAANRAAFEKIGWFRR